MSCLMRNIQQAVARRKREGFWLYPPPTGAFVYKPSPTGFVAPVPRSPRKPTPRCAGGCGCYVHAGKRIRLKGGAYMCRSCFAKREGAPCPGS